MGIGATRALDRGGVCMRHHGHRARTCRPWAVAMRQLLTKKPLNRTLAQSTPRRSKPIAEALPRGAQKITPMVFPIAERVMKPITKAVAAGTKNSSMKLRRGGFNGQPGQAPLDGTLIPARETVKRNAHPQRAEPRSSALASGCDECQRKARCNTKLIAPRR